MALELLLAAIDDLGIIRGAVRQLVLDQQAVEDVTQDTLIVVAEKIGTFRGEARFSTWLHQIARFKAIDHLRRQRETTTLDDTAAIPSDAVRLSSMISSRTVLRELIDQLPEHYRVAIVLRDVESLPYDEIARREGIPLNTAKTRVARGRALIAGQACFRRPGEMEVPRLIGRYPVTGVIGTGAFSAVYRAIDERLGSEVAIKLLGDHHSLDPDIRERFIAEARLLRRVSNPHVVRLYELDETERHQPYLVLELVPGGNLSTHRRLMVGRGLNVTSADVLIVAAAVTDALTALHTERIVHRDLSPSNLLLRRGCDWSTTSTDGLIAPDEQLVLADLGLVEGPRGLVGLDGRGRDGRIRRTRTTRGWRRRRAHRRVRRVRPPHVADPRATPRADAGRSGFGGGRLAT